MLISGWPNRAVSRGDDQVAEQRQLASTAQSNPLTAAIMGLMFAILSHRAILFR
jgi:hypothetical protein